ncbi:MAG TPA: pyridoxal-phosphate dependent enzyme [Saprospiraceae bacterium]|nr:pyridoxal-phosphate dependent enzyme [Saprospiraceae bacterium]
MLTAGIFNERARPLHAHLIKTERAEVFSATDQEALQAGYLLSKIEGIIPALESAHALAALEMAKFRKDDVVVVNLSGRGDKDLATYIAHLP